MSLISIHRSPTPTDIDDCVGSECTNSTDDLLTNSLGTKSRSLSECYFTVRGAAVILSHSDEASVSPHSSGNYDIEEHLQGMLRILRPEDTLSMAVRLQCSSENHAKYLAVVSTFSVEPFSAKGSTVTLPDQIMLKERRSIQDEPVDEDHLHEVALIGFDVLPLNRIIIGAIIPIQRGIRIELDGDGGIIVTDSSSSYYLFKPVSIQSMWSLFQCLHKEIALVVQRIKPPSPIASTSAGDYLRNSHLWLNYYESLTSKDDVMRARWHYSVMDDAMQVDFRATSGVAASTTSGGLFSAVDLAATASNFDQFSSQLPEMSCAEAEARICSNLKYIMQSVDLDAVTSRDIRERLEQRLAQPLGAYKEFIDRNMLVILGQLDKPSRIFDYLYLGTEWNASNWEELKSNRVGYILNVTKEVDNFFPTQFKYLKIWVSDEANTELLRHWQRTYDFIKEAKDNGGVVLVHCKKGISRSSSTVIAYIMKEYGWSLENSLRHVKRKRDCITPNSGFMQQLQTFYGVLQASSNRHSSIFNTSKKSATTTTGTTPSSWVISARSRSKISVSAQL